MRGASGTRSPYPASWSGPAASSERASGRGTARSRPAAVSARCERPARSPGEHGPTSSAPAHGADGGGEQLGGAGGHRQDDERRGADLPRRRADDRQAPGPDGSAGQCRRARPGRAAERRRRRPARGSRSRIPRRRQTAGHRAPAPAAVATTANQPRGPAPWPSGTAPSSGKSGSSAVGLQRATVCRVPIAKPGPARYEVPATNALGAASRPSTSTAAPLQPPPSWRGKGSTRPACTASEPATTSAPAPR